MTAFNMGPLRVYLDDLTGRLSVSAFIRIMDMEECGKRTVKISRIRTALLAYSTQNPIYTAHKMIGKIGNAIRITFTVKENTFSLLCSFAPRLSIAMVRTLFSDKRKPVVRRSRTSKKVAIPVIVLPSFIVLD